MLARQALVDPDHIFGPSSKTISLDQVFAGHGGHAASTQVGDRQPSPRASGATKMEPLAPL
jgi:hypothetical protein